MCHTSQVWHICLKLRRVIRFFEVWITLSKLCTTINGIGNSQRCGTPLLIKCSKPLHTNGSPLLTLYFFIDCVVRRCATLSKCGTPLLIAYSNYLSVKFQYFPFALMLICTLKPLPLH